MQSDKYIKTANEYIQAASDYVAANKDKPQDEINQFLKDSEISEPLDLIINLSVGLWDVLPWFYFTFKVDPDYYLDAALKDKCNISLEAFYNLPLEEKKYLFSQFNQNIKKLFAINYMCKNITDDVLIHKIEKN